MKNKNCLYPVLFSALCILFLCLCSCASAVSAQEYFSLGMAYFELGKYAEAEKWLNRARQADRTMVASTYNLGRLAFERQMYDEAVRHFETVLKRDPDNVLALKAAAYTRIKTGDINIAEKHYSRLLVLVPESADDGYNHALMLFALERYSDAKVVLERYPIALQENKDTMLLHARSQAALKEIEAIDSFANWLGIHADPKVRYEYAQTLQQHELYARALEEFRKAHSEIAATAVNPKKSDIRFAIARVLLIADGNNTEGITELQGAVTDGFNDVSAIEKLTENRGISTQNMISIQNILSSIRTQSPLEQNLET